VALGIERDRNGYPKWIAFTEDGVHARKVQLRFVRSIGSEGVRLLGPREGYHITRVMRDVDE
jgi:hypothetical protein